jgi:uncharacterized membrane protein
MASTPGMNRTWLGLNRKTQTTIVWAIVGFFVLFQIVRVATDVIPPGLASIIQPLIFIGIALFHCTLTYRVRDFLAFFVITFIVSNIMENTSILTGFPFGHYYYSSNLGPKLFNVPLIIGPGYFGVGYLAWTLARVLIGVREYRPLGRNVFLLPVSAAFIMVCWDMCIDPIRSTIEGSWVWVNGGPYFGVPFFNFVPGWYLTVFIIFQLFALYLYRFANPPAGSLDAMQPKSYWYVAVAAYATITIEMLLRPLVDPNVKVTDPGGQTWLTGDIYQSMALVTIYAMIFISVLSTIRTALDEKIPTSTDVANNRSGDVADLAGGATAEEEKGDG